MTNIYPLTIGSITLNQHPFEGPNGDQGGLSDLGSKQKSVVREFPGGIISAQLYGSFPKVISWAAKLFGFNAMNRSAELKKLCDNGQLVNFNWAQWNFDGFVEDYKVLARGPNEIDYEIIFRPLNDNNTVTGGNSLVNNDPFASTVLNAQNTMNQQASSPLASSSLPPTVVPNVNALNSSINQALQQSGGSISNIPPSTLTTLQGHISSIQNSLKPIINGNNPLAASTAADLNGTLSILYTAFSSSLNPLITTLQVANPNLYLLASQYYGDPKLYWIIGNANNLIDPMPETNGPITLKIPVKPIITSITPPTVTSDALSAA